jgi:DinB family protein
VDDRVIVAIEINDRAWRAMRDAAADLTGDEARWRPLPQSNNIESIVRHLRIEAEWHLNSLLRGEPMPSEVTPALQARIDAVPTEFHENFARLESLTASFIDALRSKSLDELRDRSHAAYGTAAAASGAVHLLAYHHAMHLLVHVGPIRMIRNLYRRTRGEAGRFFPHNPTYPDVS